MNFNKKLTDNEDLKDILLKTSCKLQISNSKVHTPSFAKGLIPFFTLNWSEYSDLLMFPRGLNLVTGGLWLTDTAHHYLAIVVLFLVAGHM